MKKIKFIGLILLLVVVSLFTGCSKENEEDETCGTPFNVDLGADKVIQLGETLTINATTANATYLWSTGETTSTITVDTTGVYVVTVTTCYGSVTDSILVELSYPTVKLTTSFGDMRFWLYHQTPLHRENFLNLASDGFYDGLIFHRIVENFVIQGGDPEGTGFGGPGYTIPAEILPGIVHQYGAVGAARLGDDVNPEKESNGSQFYIVCDPNGEPGLNGNYTVFGQVFGGIEVVNDISMVEVDGNNRPVVDVNMEQVSIEYLTADQLQTQFNFQIPF